MNFKHSTSVQKFHFRGDDTNSDLCIQIQRTWAYRMVLWDIIGLLHYYKITILLRLIPPANTFKPTTSACDFLLDFSATPIRPCCLRLRLNKHYRRSSGSTSRSRSPPRISVRPRQDLCDCKNTPLPRTKSSERRNTKRRSLQFLLHIPDLFFFSVMGGRQRRKVV